MMKLLSLASLISAASAAVVVPLYKVIPVTDFKTVTTFDGSFPATDVNSTALFASNHMCLNKNSAALVPQSYWCDNSPVVNVNGSFPQILSFDLPLVDTTNYYFGITYNNVDPTAVVTLTVDGSPVAGTLSTRSTGANSIETVQSSVAPIIPGGGHKLEIAVTSGSISIYNVIVSVNPVVPSPVLPASGGIVVQMQSFSNSVTAINPKADTTFINSGLANFCKGSSVIPIWCFTAPTGLTTKSSLDFNVVIPVAGFYYFAINYSTNTTLSDIQVAVNGIYGAFGPIVSPQTSFTGGNIAAVWGVAASTMTANLAAGSNTISIKIMKGEIKADYFILSTEYLGTGPAPTGFEIGSTGTVKVSTTPAVAAQGNVKSNPTSTASVSVPVIIAAVFGGVAVVLAVVFLVIIIRKKNASAANNGGAPAVVDTPKVEQMTAGTN